MKKSKRVKKTNFWKFKQNQDHFFKKSKVLGYRSRASFKLIELNDKFKFIKKNSTLVDLGAYPGGWSQVAENIIINGKILAVDIKNMEPLQNTQFLNCDILNPNLHEKILSYFDGKLDVVISDMAADTTGNKALDCIRTNQLCTHALNLSLNLLKPQGVFVS